jgi:peptide/nickel transport system substrate-binding protein
MTKSIFLYISIILLPFLACKNSKTSEKNGNDFSKFSYQGKKAGNATVVIHELSDPDKLNPITSQGASSTYIEHNVFMYLLDVDKEKLEVIPWLAKARPTITAIETGEYAGGLKIDYEIKEEAVWDNGMPVTAYDVAFSLKATMNPHVDAEHQRPYIEFIKDVVIDAKNPKKFSFYTKEKNYAAEFSSGGTVFTIPEHVYDPKQLMRAYTLKQLADKKTVEKIRNDKNLRAFASAFNAEFFQRERVEGCGPYRFEGWKTNERIKLVKKENWWGEKYKAEKSFEAFPPEIIYEIISDQVTAVTAMKDEAIDLMYSVKPAEYHKLVKNEDFNKKFNLKQEESFAYTYIGVNTKNEILKDKNVRKALAHITDVNKIISVIYYDYAQEIACFVHPRKKHYNTDLKPYTFDLQKAISLLEAAGFTQTDENGTRYRTVNGQMQKLSFSIKYNSGNDQRENIASFMKENAKKVGIQLEVEAREWTVYLEECKNHDFDLYVLGWIQEAILDDPKQLFHTEAINGGSNYVGFGNAYTDQLILNIRTEMDEAKRIVLFKELQAIIHDEVPYIFLFAPYNLMAINKRFEEVKTYIARPGYDERELKLAKRP